MVKEIFTNATNLISVSVSAMSGCLLGGPSIGLSEPTRRQIVLMNALYLYTCAPQIPEPWVEEPPARVPYIPRFVYDENKQEDSTQVVFLTLTSVFVIIVICCLLEVYRSHLAYKKRIERETDEDIIWSKEQATKMHESPGVKAGLLGGVTAGSGNGLPPYTYKAVSINLLKGHWEKCF